MNQPASFPRLRSLYALCVVFVMAGCIKVGSSGGDGGGDDECDHDDDCDGSEICNDGECESPGSGGSNPGGTGGTGAGGTSTGGSASGTGGTGGGGTTCTRYCDFASRCGDTTVEECVSDCQLLYGTGGACSSSLDTLADCVAPYTTDCAAAEQYCTAQANAVVGNCAGDEPCPYTDDNVCDEPDICAEGTDVNDCVCPYTNDGDCDEPEGLNLCPDGSDVNDCECANSPGNMCMYACDQECDEAAGTGLCPAGSDQWDCTHYP